MTDALRRLTARWLGDIRACPLCRQLGIDSESRCPRCQVTLTHVDQVRALLAEKGEPIASRVR